MLIASVNMHKQRITMLAVQDDQTEIEIDQEQREMSLFYYFNANSFEETPYKIQKYEDTDDDEQEETEENTKEPEPEEEEEEKIVTTKMEANRQMKQEQMMRELTYSVREEASGVINWSRKRFFTTEQKTKTYLNI